MKKTILTVILMLCFAAVANAGKPRLTEGFDKYNNSFKVDLVSLGYMSPQIEWEHFTNSRFSYGVYAQAHFMNRSTAVRANNERVTLPTQVELHGKMYDLDWSDHPLNWYADVTMADGKHEVKWDRKYVGVMICPEGRFYMGRKPDRGMYFAGRVDMGIFRETFVVSRTRLTLDEEHQIYMDKRAEAASRGEDPDKVSNNIEDRWKRAGTEKGETFLALGCGFGLGYQGWFKKNSHWGFDLSCFGKSDWKFSEDDNTWEWFWGAGSPLDFNAAIIYRF